LIAATEPEQMLMIRTSSNPWAADEPCLNNDVEHLVLENVDWNLYESLLRNVGHRPLQLSYDCQARTMFSQSSAARALSEKATEQPKRPAGYVPVRRTGAHAVAVVADLIQIRRAVPNPFIGKNPK